MWDLIFSGGTLNQALESLRIGLESGTAAQFGLIAVYVLAGHRRKSAAALFLGLIALALAVAVVVNAAVGAGLPAAFRLANYFIELLLGPLVLGFVARAGAIEPSLRRVDAWHAIGLVAGALALVSDRRFAPDAVVWLSQAGYLIAAARTLRRRREALRAQGLLRLAAALASGLATIVVLRVWLSLDAQGAASYRLSPGYLSILLAVFLLASFVLLEVLRQPGIFGTRPAATPLPDPEDLQLGQELIDLVDRERLYLEPNLTVGRVAQMLGTSPRAVARAVAADRSGNFSRFINRRRVEAASRALRAGDGASITTIMFDSGFGSKSAFQREFRRHFGVTPSEYRERHVRPAPPG